jgi:hypothetical protein
MGDTSRQACLREVSMPWKECSVMEERLRFVVRLLEGEAINPLSPSLGVGLVREVSGLDRLTLAPDLSPPLAAPLVDRSHLASPLS